MVTKALFAQRDFTDMTILEEFQESLEVSVRSQLTESGLYMGASCLLSFSLSLPFPFLLPSSYEFPYHLRRSSIMFRRSWGASEKAIAMPHGQQGI